MPSSKKRASTTISSGIPWVGENGAQSPEGVHVEDERITARRMDMLRTRQIDLDKLMDSHDDLVREAFQLDKFVTLLSYDPKVAKQDNSQVFLEYKAPHDLISKSTAASGSGQNSRKTRRATVESRESLVATISTGASTPPVTPSSTTKGKGKVRVQSGVALTSSMGRCAGKTVAQTREARVPEIPSPVSKGKGKAREVLGLSHLDIAGGVAPSPPPLPSRSVQPRKVKDGTASVPFDLDGQRTPLTAGELRTLAKSLTLPYPSESSSSASRRLRRSLDDPKRDPGIEKRKPPDPPITSRSTIKRIRLFQRPPPALYTNPSQLPPPPQHGRSILGFFDSYTSLEDAVDMSREGLERTSLAEAKTRARIRELRKEGRLMLDIPELPDGSSGIPSISISEEGAVEELMRNEDHYDHLVSAAAHRGRMVANEYSIKKATAKRVAKLVMGWHGTREGAEEKQRKIEAARMKTLAKYTVKEVEKQWKKAVMAVREHNQTVIEAEEARLGRKHLDAILDQSGVILEAQHTDLTRTRSRSSSARDWSGSDRPDDDDDDAVEGDENDIESELGEDEDAPDERGEDDTDAALLLGADSRSSFGSGDPGSEAETEPAVPRDEASQISSPRDTTASKPGASLDTPLMNMDMDISFSRTPSEIAIADLPTIGSETISSTLSAVHASIDLQEEHDTPMDDDVFVGHHPDIVSTNGDRQLVGSVDEGSGSESLADVPRRKAYRSSMSPPRSRYSPSLRSSPPALSPPNSSSCLRSPQLPLRRLHPPELPRTSPGTASSSISASPFESEAPLLSQTTAHTSVAIRLSNGVVIYRDSKPSSVDEAPYSLSPNQGSTAPNGHQSDPSSVTANETSNNGPSGVTMSAKEIRVPGLEVDLKPDPSRANLPGDTTTIEPVATPATQSDIIAFQTASKAIDIEPTEASHESADADAVLDTASVATSNEEIVVPHETQIAPHLADFAVAHVEWDPSSKVGTPFLLRGTLRPYQQSGLEWLASLHTNSLNGILADEMGLGKTIQTIALLAHLACDHGIWGPHLIVVPTSVLLNWEMEFKKFLPGFKILPYHGSTKRRKELRIGWNNKHSFNVCVTSYTLASRDAHIFKRKAWYYMILDEAHMIKNFKSQRWNILLMFRSFRRLLLTGTPLQNNLTELWALLQFLMSGTNFANLKEFGDWFSNPLEKAIEQGTVMDKETQERVKKLHTVLRPYLLRRLKADVEKELPSKFDHLVICRLSKRQRFLYDEFMSRAQTRDALASGVYHKVANILMQLRKVCNHPDLFEVRPIVTSFAMPRSATADFEIKELLIRRRFSQHQGNNLNLDFLGLVFTQHQGKSMMQARSTRALDASSSLPFITDIPGEPPPVDTRTIEGFRRHMKYQQQLATLRQWTQIAYTNHVRCVASPVYGSETISIIRRLYAPLVPLSGVDFRHPDHLDRSRTLPTMIKSYQERAEDMDGFVDRFAFVTPAVTARDMPFITLSGFEPQILRAQNLVPTLDTILHRASVKLQIAFPDASLIQYDCGKLQELASLLHKRKAGGHRVLIFTQMTKVLDILEIFLNFHGYRYLRLDGATKIEDRQYITERFNNDTRVFAFIASSRSGGVGINLTGADTVVFYDSDFNPQMDRQCEDRAHRIGQMRDVHIYRFISEHTVEESMLRKANQKRSLDNIVIQQGEFDWRSLLIDDEAFGKALGEFEDKEDAHAARVAAREEAVKEVEDRVDFAGDADDAQLIEASQADVSMATAPGEEEPIEEEEGTIADYMLAFVKRDWEWFSALR